MKTAAIYARYSSERQTEQSIEGQLRVCREFAKANDIRIIDEYIDRAMTGTNDNRPAFQKMLSDSDKLCPWDIVLVYAIDRFGRNSIEIAINKHRLEKNGKVLISATQRTSSNIDGTKNLDGILLENVLIGLAEYYSAELAVKIKRGMRESRCKGQYTGGSIVYGYKVNNKKIEIDHDQAEVVLTMFNMYANGYIAQDILDVLHNKGITHNGKTFLPNTIYNMLHNEKYIGKCTFNGETYTNIYPAIVPLDLFEKVQSRLAHNKLGQKSREVDFLLKGKLFCGYCGKKMNGESGTSRTGKVMYYYKCATRKKKKGNCNKHTVPKDFIENAVLDIAMDLFTNKVNLNIIADEIMRTVSKSRQDQSILKLLLQQKQDAEKSLKNVMTAIEQGVITATTKNRVTELENEIDGLQAKILEEECNLQNQVSREDIMDYLTYGVRQSSPQVLLDILVNKIELFDDEIVVYFNYSDKTNPDNPDTDARDFLLPCGYNAIATTRYLVVIKKT